MNSTFQYESNTKVIGKGCNMLRKYCNHSWACSPQEPPQGPADSSAGLRCQARHFLFLPFVGVIIIVFFALLIIAPLTWYEPLVSELVLMLSWCRGSCRDQCGLFVTESCQGTSSSTWSRRVLLRDYGRHWISCSDGRVCCQLGFKYVHAILKYVQFFNSHTLVFHKGIDGAQIIPHLRNELKYSQYSQDWLQMLLVGRGKTSASCAVGTKDGTMSNTSCLIRPGTLQLVCTRIHEHIHWQYSDTVIFW